MDTTSSMILEQELKAVEKLLRFIYLIRCRNICGICNLQLTTKTNLNEHMEVHTGTSYTCDCCKVICDTWTGYQEHIRSIHRLMVFCPYCYKAHTNYWRLSLHWRIHEPYECKICYYTFKTLSHLRDHHTALHCEIPFDLPFRSVPEQREE